MRTRKDRNRERLRRDVGLAIAQAMNLVGQMLAARTQKEIIEDVEHTVVSSEIQNERWAKDNAVEFNRRYRNQTR